jgi:predicted RNase H-like nuclease (RuvC/YqgF family)
MGEDPMTMEELTERVMELSDRVARLEALVEEFRRTREELKAEIRELRTYMIGGFIVVIAVSVLLKLLG